MTDEAAEFMRAAKAAGWHFGFAMVTNEVTHVICYASGEKIPIRVCRECQNYMGEDDTIDETICWEEERARGTI